MAPRENDGVTGPLHAILREEGVEFVHVYVDLMNAGATLEVIQNAVHIHPTLAEDIESAVF